MNTRDILPLTGLRFVAAFLVFVFHVHIRWPISDHPLLANFLSQGAVGMTLFFMLSGYILAHTYAGRDSSAWQFYRNRFARIYPVYVAAALITFPWLIVHLRQAESMQMAVAQGAAILTTSTLMIQAWFPQLFGYWNNAAAWSLSAEAFFYLLFPVLLPLLMRLNARALWLSLAAAYALSILPGFIYAASSRAPRMGFSSFTLCQSFASRSLPWALCCFSWRVNQLYRDLLVWLSGPPSSS